MPPNTREFAANLNKRLASAITAARADHAGYDERVLLKIKTQDRFVPDELSKVSSEVEVVSQEATGLLLAFASEAALALFEQKLLSIIKGEEPTYRHVLFALDSFESWSADDRMGWSISNSKLPSEEPFSIDVELLPREEEADRGRLTGAFESFATDKQIEIVDKISDPGLVMFRVRTNRAGLTMLLHYRDVRKVDLPPRYALSNGSTGFDIQDVAEIEPPPNNAPRIGILDTGIETAHPLLRSAVGDAQVFCTSDSGVSAKDDHGHGTQVAGIALYGDVEACALARSFVPRFWLLSGRVLDESATYYAPTFDGSSKTRLIENDVAAAVDYFVQEYGCKIFNISFGDLNRTYRGGRIEGLAVKLDSLAREKDVLFVVSTGNVADYVPRAYPGDLFNDDNRLIDPATAANAITVGGLARSDLTRAAMKHATMIADLPIARANEPAPFTRVGPGSKGMIKPDFADFAGNWATDTARTSLRKKGLGITTTAYSGTSFTGPICEAIGTSFAAPNVANLAASVQAELPDAAPSLIRAVLACHAHQPKASQALVADRVLSVVGYGKVDATAVANSHETDVTLYSTDKIANDKVHFYEVPIPAEFLSVGKRERHLSVALSYFPPARSTRLDYLATKISFHLVKGTLEDASRWFNAAIARDELDSIQEYSNNREITQTERSRGTLQMSRWVFKVSRKETPRFVLVVTRHDAAWGTSLTRALEEYSVAVRISDRGNVGVNLHAILRNLIRPRVRARR